MHKEQEEITTIDKQAYSHSFTPLKNFMDIKNNLKNFYDAEAKKYASTRKKHRTDADIVLEKTKKACSSSGESGKKSITILEFGCGSWRFLEHLKNLKGIKIKYTGVDISNELLKIAKKENKDMSWCEFVCDDITNYVKTLKQESFDFIVGIASFQHIPTKKERIFLMKNFYRLLKYDGELIMTNRALSKRFLKKHKIQIFKALVENIISLGKRSMRDIMVPRSSSANREKNHYRFYHMFGLKELKKLVDVSGFTSEKLTYIDQDGLPIQWRTQANNSFLVAKKDVFSI